MGARRLLAAASHFLGWGYADEDGENRFPIIKGCLPSKFLIKKGEAPLINCSTFTTALVNYGYPDVDWDEKAYADMQIMDGGRLWSPVDAWARHGIGAALPEGVAAPGWGIYQAWVDDKTTAEDGDPISGGHQWLYHAKLGLRLHSSSRHGRGPAMDRDVTWDYLVSYYKDGIRGVALG